MIIIKRPIATILIGAIIGIIYGLYFKTSIATTVILLAFLLFLIQKNRYKTFFFFAKRRKIFLVIFISAIISNVYLNLTNSKYEKVYKENSKNIKTVATVISEAKETEYYYSYKIKVDSKAFMLYVNKNYPQKLKYGMCISLAGTYSKPTEARNYKGFNYKEYLKTKKIYGSIKAGKINVIKENNVNLISKISNDIRNKIISTAKSILPNKTSSLIVGILIGEKDSISEEVTNSFRKSSISHILAISGTHISYIVLGVSFLLTKSKTPKKIMHITTILVLILYMLITSFIPSVIRACIMGIIIILSRSVYRKADIYISISISLLIILIDNPFAIKDVGLQLSYLGTLGIVTLSKPISKFLKKYIKEKIATILAVTISAQIMVLPVTILNFNEISTVFLISNILAVPLSGAIILFGFANIFIGMVSLKIGKTLAIFTHSLVQLLIWIAEYISKISFSSITVTTPSIVTIITYYILIYIFYKHKTNRFRRKAIMGFAILVVCIIILTSLLIKPFKIHFVDVGQRRLYCYYNTF